MIAVRIPDLTPSIMTAVPDDPCSQPKETTGFPQEMFYQN
jgi:hypothetical protein